MTLTGAGAESTIIDGGGIDRVFDINFFAGQITVNMTGVTIQNGNAENTGGGAINNRDSSLTITNSIITNNTAAIGGGITNSTGTVTIRHSTISNNIGGGLNTGLGTINISDSLISGNRAVGGGGITASGTLTITGSTISGNTATKSGGGISSSGSVTITNSTLSHNAAARGGAMHIFLAGTLTIANSTISSNLAAVAGGGINNASGTITLTNSTMSDNTAARGGALHNPSGTVTLLHTIVANSPQGGNCFGPSIVSLGHNLDSGSSCGFSGPGELTNTDPLLGPLADNGGSTLTHTLLSGSPAIDAGDNAGCPAADQRSFDRPTDGDGDGAAGCDIGAYEAGESVMLEIAAISPTKGGNAGSVTIVIQGGVRFRICREARRREPGGPYRTEHYCRPTDENPRASSK